MRIIDLLKEQPEPNTTSASMKLQADRKSEEARKMRLQATMAKKREQINGTRSSLDKKQSELSKLQSSSS